tara:strand:+ start:40 stop:786 length:747 start_codon:yes stop_codon:yes gene_type:complete
LFFLFSHYKFKSSIRIYEFPPNNLESGKAKYISHLNLADDKWCVRDRFKFEEETFLAEKNPTPLIENYSKLDLYTIQKREGSPLDSINTYLPQWRATLGLGNNLNNQKFYQSEIFFAPDFSSCLSFIPGCNKIDNNEREIWLINATHNSFKSTKCLITFFNNNGEKIMKDSFQVRSNAANFYKLPKDLAKFDSVISIKKMAAIPLILDLSSNEVLSIEHTHPSPSFFSPNTRSNIARKLKTLWMNNHE